MSVSLLKWGVYKRSADPWQKLTADHSRGQDLKNTTFIKTMLKKTLHKPAWIRVPTFQSSPREEGKFVLSLQRGEQVDP